jgi:hypothetical protein
VRGSSLDVIVETSRSNSISAIVGRLRTLTTNDLGPDPKSWLKDYLTP